MKHRLLILIATVSLAPLVFAEEASLSPSPNPTVPVSASTSPSITQTPARVPPSFKVERDEKRWKKLSDDGTVQTYEERDSVEGVVAFRGESIIPTSLMRIATVLQDQSLRKKWVDALIETKVLEQPSLFDRTEYNRTHVPWPFQDRDFVFRAKIKVELEKQKTLLISMNSVENEAQPKVPGVVRGQIVYSNYFMREIPGAEPQTEVIIEMALDPKGAMPMWLVNLVQKRWPHNTLKALKNFAIQPDLVVPKEIEDYFKGSQFSGEKK